MQLRHVSLALAFLLALPAASGAWAVKGAYEPDTVYDLAGMMQLEPDVDTRNPRAVVYLNGFAGTGATFSTSLNPNVASLASNVAGAPFLPVAMFGIWRDCNGDGYVGHGDQGLLEYRAELLEDARVCPPVPDPASPAWRAHNDGRWVVELMPIGYDDITTEIDENPLNVNDTTARVWADWGLPGDPPGLACATHPAPYGTFRSTGGLLRWLDCFAGFRATRAATTAADAAGAPELGFSDAEPDRPDESASPLNRPNPWGAEGDRAAVVVFDCADREEVVLSDPTDPGDGTGRLHTVSVPGTPLALTLTDSRGRLYDETVSMPTLAVDPEGSAAGTVNETQAGADDCDRGDQDETVDVDGRRAGSDAGAPYALEGPNEPVSPYAPRSRTDFAFTFEEGARGTGVLAGALGARTRDDGGLGLTSVTGLWVATSSAVAGRNAYVGRQDLEAERVSHLTYYAAMDPGLAEDLALTLPLGLGTNVYGVDACGLACDPSLWWRGPGGEDVTPRDARLGVDEENPTVPSASDATRIGVRVGQRYQMRDVDCYDASFSAARASGLQWGALTSTACARP